MSAVATSAKSSQPTSNQVRSVMTTRSTSRLRSARSPLTADDLAVLPHSITSVLSPTKSWEAPLLRFLVSATRHELLDPNELYRGSASGVASCIEHLVCAYSIIDRQGGFTEEMNKPFYREYLHEFIQRADTRMIINKTCNLLQYICRWPINTRNHFSYDWLHAVLLTPNYPVNEVNAHGETALSYWSNDQRIRNGLVFHELVRAGVNVYQLDWVRFDASTFSN